VSPEAVPSREVLESQARRLLEQARERTGASVERMVKAFGELQPRGAVTRRSWYDWQERPETVSLLTGLAAMHALGPEASMELVFGEPAGVGAGVDSATTDARMDQLQSVSGSGETRTRTGDTTIFSRMPSTGECGRLQRNRERVLGRHIREDSRNFVAIAALSGTRSRTCAQMTSGTRLRAPGLPGCRAIGPNRRPGLSHLARDRAGDHRMARRRARLSQPLGECVKGGAGACR
jgi:hypothetical protein